MSLRFSLIPPTHLSRILHNYFRIFRIFDNFSSQSKDESTKTAGTFYFLTPNSLLDPTGDVVVKNFSSPTSYSIKAMVKIMRMAFLSVN